MMGIAIMLKPMIDKGSAHLSGELDSSWGTLVHIISIDNPSNTDIKPFAQIAMRRIFIGTCLDFPTRD